LVIALIAVPAESIATRAGAPFMRRDIAAWRARAVVVIYTIFDWLLYFID
jgi:hypothetical protein